RIARAIYRTTKYLKSRPVYILVDRFLDSVQKNPHKAFIRFQDKTYSYAHTQIFMKEIHPCSCGYGWLWPRSGVPLLFSIITSDPNHCCTAVPAVGPMR
ncbi:hypothetical protein M9458_049133, partial [Cirrhinus mrigala]